MVVEPRFLLDGISTPRELRSRESRERGGNILVKCSSGVAEVIVWWNSHDAGVEKASLADWGPVIGDIVFIMLP